MQVTMDDNMFSASFNHKNTNASKVTYYRPTAVDACCRSYKASKFRMKLMCRLQTAMRI